MGAAAESRGTGRAGAAGRTSTSAVTAAFGARGRADFGSPCRDRRAYQPETGIGHHRRAGVRDERDTLARAKQRQHPRDLRVLIVIVQRLQRPTMPSAESSRPVWRVSSHRMRSAACNASRARGVISPRLPIGVETSTRPAGTGAASRPAVHRGDSRMLLRRAFVFLLGSLALAGCAGLSSRVAVTGLPSRSAPNPPAAPRLPLPRRSRHSGRHPAAALRAAARRSGSPC